MKNNEIMQELNNLKKEIIEIKSKNDRTIKNLLLKSLTKFNVIIGVLLSFVIASVLLFAAQISFTNGTVISAADVNSNFTELYTNVNNINTEITNVSASVWNNANQSIPNNTLTTVNFNSERYDTDSIHSTSSNTNRLTFNTAGLYLVILHITFDPNTTGTRWFQLNKNGSLLNYWGHDNYLNSNYGVMLRASELHRFIVGDYMQLQVSQNSGGALNITTSSEISVIRLAN